MPRNPGLWDGIPLGFSDAGILKNLGCALAGRKVFEAIIPNSKQTTRRPGSKRKILLSFSPLTSNLSDSYS